MKKFFIQCFIVSAALLLGTAVIAQDTITVPQGASPADRIPPPRDPARRHRTYGRATVLLLTVLVYRRYRGLSRAPCLARRHGPRGAWRAALLPRVSNARSGPYVPRRIRLEWPRRISSGEVGRTKRRRMTTWARACPFSRYSQRRR